MHRPINDISVFSVPQSRKLDMMMQHQHAPLRPNQLNWFVSRFDSNVAGDVVTALCDGSRMGLDGGIQLHRGIISEKLGVECLFDRN